MKKTESKQKLDAISTTGIPKVIYDIIVLYREDILGMPSLEDEVYALIVAEVIKVLKGEYRKQLKSMDVASKQIDLETAIMEMKELELNKTNANVYTGDK